MDVSRGDGRDRFLQHPGEKFHRPAGIELQPLRNGPVGRAAQFKAFRERRIRQTKWELPRAVVRKRQAPLRHLR